MFKYLQWLPIPAPYLPRQCLAFVLAGGGLGLRFAAINSLGRLFSTRVQIHSNHQLITSGPYRAIRHPSYSGILLAFAGAGIAFGDVLALLILLIPGFMVINARVELEEQWLTRAFGEQYLNYCQRTQKLIPLVY
jgi:protein-S-isoprenylcysteine O-methyltransferase Ste14